MNKQKDCKQRLSAPCCKYHKFQVSRKFNTTWLPVFIVAILPKCPFCVMAYSGAVTLCSGSTLFPNQDSSSSIVILMLCLVVLASIGFNYKDRRTIVALVIAGIGSTIILLSQLVVLSQPMFYSGVSFLFIGTWLNGSLIPLTQQYFNNRLLLNSNKKRTK